MKEVLKSIYLEGFREDGDDYADYFCGKHIKNAIVFPPDSPLCAGYVIKRKLSNGYYCAYFSAIATKQSERGKGYASKLIKLMLNKSYTDKYPFVVLSPFNSVFYKKFGFFTTQYCKKSILKGSVLADVCEATYDDLAAINALFDPEALRLDFSKEYFAELKTESAVYGGVPLKIVHNGKIVGFCVKDELSVSKVVQNDINVYDIDNFVGSTAKIPSTNGDAFIQLRIVSFPQFVGFLSPNSDFEVTIKIVDEIISENNAEWRIVSENSKITAYKEVKSACEYKVDIADFVEYMEQKKLIKPFVTQFIDEY